MRIADAIGQTKAFRNNRHKVLVNLLFSNNWVLAQLRSFFKPHGVTEKQYNILRILNGSDKPLTTSIIRNRLIDKMSDTTRVIDRMIKKGIVTKEINKLDRRLVDIALSPKGKKLLSEIDKEVSKIDQVMGNLTLEEALQLSNLLDKMRSS